MLTYLLATRNEGPDFDFFLRALARAKGSEDTLLVIHAGDEQTLRQLQAFAEHHPTRIIQTDSPVDRLGDLLQLGLKVVETEYTFALTPTDRLQGAAIKALRAHLGREAPDLCLVNSAWWLADTEHPLPRSDSALFEALPTKPDAAACASLLPDPRRLIFRTADWVARTATWPTGLDGKALYERALAESTDLSSQNTPALLHLFTPVDPGPVLSDCTDALAARPKGARAACLAEWAPLLDEHLALCPPAKATVILNALPRIAALLPRQVRRNLDSQSASIARLLAARFKDGDLGAKAELSLLLATQQQRRTDILAEVYGKLRQDLDLALPGPDYLRALYTRLRGL